jgi:hypothetical protein
MIKRLFQAAFIYIFVKTAWIVFKYVMPMALFIALYLFLSH